jgi:hypothetical protein
LLGLDGLGKYGSSSESEGRKCVPEEVLHDRSVHPGHPKFQSVIWKISYEGE